MFRFINGLPEKLAFFMLGLVIQKLNQKPYHLPKQARHINIEFTKQCAAVGKGPSFRNAQSEDISEMKSQIYELTSMMKKLTPDKAFQQSDQRQSSGCYNCSCTGHAKRYCNWNGSGTISAEISCQLCNQSGHGAGQCLKFKAKTDNYNRNRVVCQICSKPNHTAFECYHNQFAQQGNPNFLGDTRHGPSGRKYLLQRIDRILAALILLIILKPDMRPLHQKPYRLTPHKKEVLRHHLDELLQGVICELNATEEVPITSPVVLVAKRSKPSSEQISEKTSSLRQFRFFDFRYLNTQTEPLKSFIPDIQELTESFTERIPNYIASIDMSSGFFQMKLSPNSSKYTAFNTCFGTFKFLRVPMGLHTAPNSFQLLMDKILRGLTFKSCLCYLQSYN
ncbi:unnamed protein product [Mytilus coruscus]|uniref:CCHC-type domain-containing protein n=1 Tax=Mytilus coruscus TaxID=42192 RepID=A0A6J8F0G3_MYTCO|nr:unnamed protein product [Mytilus coruscus]